MIAEVTVLYEKNSRQVVQQLREAANNIEKGDAGEIQGAVFVLATPGGGVDIYAWGDLDNFSALGVLERGKRKIHEVIDGPTG